MPTIRNDQLEVMIDEMDLTVSVRTFGTGTRWQMQTDGPGDLGIKGHCGPWQGMMFSEAGQRRWEQRDDYCKVTLTGWPYSANVWSPLGFGIEVTYQLAGPDLKITLAPHHQQAFEASLIDSYYPRGFLFPDGESAGQLVLPYCQGCLLGQGAGPDLDLVLPGWVGIGFIMPWWGQLTASGEGLIALTDTPDDIGFRIKTEPGRGHTVHPYWQASLGGLKYPRIITYRFLEKATVTTLAKAYRRHAEGLGQAATLRDKMAERPTLENLVGGMILNLWIMSDFSNFKTPSRVHYIRFKEALKRYRAIVGKAGIDRAVSHIDGWGYKGYDFNHPDVLPPDERLGGWDGLKSLADGIKAIGHGFTLHDNYVDYYAHTESFKNGDGVMDLSGICSESTEWLGGRQQWLCSQEAIKYVRRNFKEIEATIGLDGVYIDCWTVGHLRECFDQRHLASRKDTREKWSEAMAFCQNLGWVVGSESGNDWSIPVMDYCHQVHPEFVPHTLKEQTDAFGIPIPLYSLVWHDCLILPGWIEQKDTGGVIREGCVARNKRDIRLWTLLWGGIPSCRPTTFDFPWSDDFDADAAFLQSLKPISDLHRQIGLEAMTDWTMEDADGTIQKTTFADGTEVMVDFGENAGFINGNRVEF